MSKGCTVNGAPMASRMHSGLTKHEGIPVNASGTYGDPNNPKHWIAGAIKHPGALHRQLGVPEGQKIPASKLAAAAKAGGVEGKRARLAQTLKGFHK